MKKNLFLILLLLSLLFITGPKVNALTAYEKNIEMNKNLLKSSKNSTNWEDKTLMFYPNYAQETSYYCGPASLKQAIQYLTGSSESQSAYAKEMGSPNSGANAYDMTQVINKKQKAHKYVETYISKGKLWNLVVSDIDQSVPIIALTNPRVLYMYSGSKSSGHYLTIIGYLDNWGDYSVYYMDTNNNSYNHGNTLGQFTEPLDNFEQSILNHTAKIIIN